MIEPKKPNFKKPIGFLIAGLIAFAVNQHNDNAARNQDRIVAQLRVLHEEYRSSFSKTDREKIARRAIDLIGGNVGMSVPPDLNNFVIVTMTTPVE